MVFVTRFLALALVFSAGCSFALGGPDPARPKYKPPQCDTGKGLVVVDGLFATAAGLTAISLMGSSNSGEREAAIAPVILGAIFAGAALRGSSVVNDCRKAMDEYVASTEAPPVLPPPVLKPTRKRVVEREQPVVEPAVATPEPAVAQPEPPPVQAPPPPPPPPAPKPQPQPKAKVDAAPWGEFWKELP
jgi:hypothetical protein